MDSLIDEIVEYGKKVSPREACGYVLRKEGKEFLFPCANVAEQITYTNPDGVVVTEDLGEKMFALDAASQVAARIKGEIVCIFHSHPHTSATPSEADRQGCHLTGVPWLVVALDGSHTFIDPSEAVPEVPLLGRDFVWGIWDCYALVKDYYEREFQIKLPQYDRGLLFSWDSGDWNKFETEFRGAGFLPVAKGQKLQRGDVFLMNLNSNTINHCALLADPVKNIIYHHVLDRKSEAAIYGGWYRDITRYVVRHKDFT